MKKLLVAVVVLAVFGALLALLLSGPEETTTGPAAGGGDAAATADDATGTATARRADPVHRPRGGDAETAQLLAVAGVATAGGAPAAGAAVDVYAAEGTADPDPDAEFRARLLPSFGAKSTDRIVQRSRTVRDALASRDQARLREVMGDGMQLGMELMGEESGIDELVLLLSPARAVAPWKAPGPKVGSARTAADGSFRVEGLAAGRVEVVVKAPRHVAAHVRVAAGDTSLKVALERGVRVFGTVSSAGALVTGATVVIAGDSATTGADGRFDFDAAHVPQETIVASAPGCVTQGRGLALRADSADREVTFDLAPAGSAAGHVTALAGGPVKGAVVSLAPSPNVFMDMMGMGGSRFDLPPAPSVTDASGAFELGGIAPGKPKLRVAAEGYLSATVAIDVKAGVATPVEVLLVRESALAGTVRDRAGDPLGGARVRVAVPARDAMAGMVAAMTGGAFRSVLTNPDGTFLLHGLAAGPREVRVEAQGFLAVKDMIEIPAEDAARHDFVLEKGYTIAGVVNGPDGKAFVGAKIRVAPKTDTNPMAGMMAMFGAAKADANAESGAGGAFTAEGLPAGPYDVTASADGYLDAVLKGVEPGRTDLVLALGAAATVTGRVYGKADMKPVAKAAVAWKPAGAAAAVGRPGRGGRNPMAAMFGGGETVTTRDDGTFEIRGIEAGDYDLTATCRGFGESEAVRVSAQAGKPFDGVELLLAPGVRVDGRVVDAAGGAPVVDAVVWAAKQGNPFAAFGAPDVGGDDPAAPSDAIGARTDGDGRFVLDGLPPGKAQIEVRAAARAPVTVNGVAAPTTELLVQMAAGGSVVGRVTGGDGGPVAGAQIMVMRGMMGGGMRQARSDATGEFRLEHLAAGSYQIMLLDPSNPMMPSGMAPVTVTEGGVTRHDFAKKVGGRQMGGGVAKDGKPLANVPIVLIGGSSGMRMTTTDETGRFGFDALDPGEYTVLVQSSFMGGGTTSKKVTVGSEGKVEDVSLQLSSAKVEGEVLDAETGKGIAGAQVVLTSGSGGAATGEDLLGGFRGQAITDGRGRFVVNDVQQGSFTLKATATGYPPVTLEGVAAGAREVRAEMRRGVELVVTVLGPGDEPVANASVSTVDAAGNPVVVFDSALSQFTKQDGVVRLRLVPGRYGISVTASNFVPARIDTDASAGAITVRLSAGATLDVYAVGADGSTPLARAVVKVLDAAGNEIRRGFSLDSFTGGNDRTGPDGRWTRRGLPAGDVTVVVTDADTGAVARVPASLANGGTQRVDVTVR